ncbi:LmbU family transcriptional regulator [Allokutzneria sp. A3M-2-11 16]|uniref:LmbU family transcriptional regulator n=1 Tax=Allokutzneria sp. A3M-2-11 16 TaxID=2962043 RepID=UPI0020B76546|nr:LmbU family transcriptional regulator [Allokutzneria sp. A3M-2-11 16]MCP3801928.1 LmbU family transcriptional regulator [Allokutzneria sp. A3M-2-11 16]
MTLRTSLTLPEKTSLQAWMQIGNQLSSVHESSAWWVGDWLVFGQDRYPDRYKKAIAETTLDYQTLRNYAWVARRFPASRRRDRLSFQHHVVVAALPAEEQDHWLELAEGHKWSRNELRRQVNASTERPDGPERRGGFNMSFSAGDLTRWRAAAEKRNLAIDLWIKTTLDRAAHES